MNSVLSVLLLCFLLASCGEEKTAKTEEAVEAEKTIQERAEAGDADAQAQLGHLYEIGDGVPQDFAGAAKWYRKAAEQGNAEAQLYLGCSYAIGRGVPKDSTEHLKWIRKAAQQGFADAQVQLGLLYEIGQGVPKDFAEAYMCMNLAATGGNKEHEELRELLEERMTGEQLIEGQKLIEEWLKREARSRKSKASQNAPSTRCNQLPAFLRATLQ